MGWSIRQLNLEKALKVVFIAEMLAWIFMSVLNIIIYLAERFDTQTLSDLLQNAGPSDPDPYVTYKKKIENLDFVCSWTLPTGFLIACAQLFLYYGIIKKNRCLIFTWMTLSVILGAVRIIVIQMFSTSYSLKIANISWLFRIIVYYLGIRYMLQITNERRSEEEVEVPHFRPQSMDPREHREGLNYPSYPRSLQFAARISAMHKSEHAHPKRWESTYEAIDDDGRVVVMLDEPMYENI